MRLISRAIVVSGVLFSPVVFAQAGGAGGAAAVTPTSAAAPLSATPAAGATPAANAPPLALPPPLPAAPAAAATPATGLTSSASTGKAVNASAGAGVGLPPNLPAITGGTNISPKEAETFTTGSTTANTPTDDWKFDFHGYARAPLRASWGPPTPAVQPSIYNYMPTTGMPAAAMVPTGSSSAPCPIQSPCVPPGTQLHAYPRVPGYLYTTWEYTNTTPGPWAQLNFTYGNSRTSMTVIVDAYNQTDGGYRNVQAQQGIDQVFLTMNFPGLFGDYGSLVWNLGSFQNRYGAAGKYDGGMYETYLFGRTHTAGSTWTANFSNLDDNGSFAVTAEAGVGSKLDTVPFLNNALYQVFQNQPIAQNNGSPYLSDRNPDYLPYAGPVPQGSTFIAHGHLGVKYKSLVQLGAHYIFAWTPDDNWSPINSGNLVDVNEVQPRHYGPTQGSMAIAGGEVRIDSPEFGYFYAGVSHIDARNINALADSIEVLHSYGGYQFKQNFFGNTFNQHTGVYNGPENESGKVTTIEAQYSFSFGQYARYPESFWGDGVDLVITPFMMLSIVDSKPADVAVNGAPATAVAGRVVGDPTRATTWDMSTKKLKFGGDVYYTPYSWLGVGFRYDMVKPDMDAAYSRTPGNPGGSELDFQVFTPRIVFRTQFVTHEAISLTYSHYINGIGAYPQYPYQWLPKADTDLIGLAGTMWW
ncbi:MAG TPA: hypothetical protein VGP07_17455 [Polyangia bacterium]|jgi:hypothetical protein